MPQHNSTENDLKSFFVELIDAEETEVSWKPRRHQLSARRWLAHSTHELENTNSFINLETPKDTE